MTKTFEERERAQAVIRANNNNAITHGQIYSKHNGKARRQTVAPPPFTKVFNAEEWALITETMGRLGTVYGNMEADAVNKEYELVAARLIFLEAELTTLTRRLIGGAT